jgi:group I intron endonuclease
MSAFIYLATNRVNGKRYIGKTKNTIKQRFDGHFASARKGAKTAFARAIRKYGEEHFSIEILEETTVEFSSDREKFFIAKLNPEYNMTSGGEGGATSTGTIWITNGVFGRRHVKHDPIPEGFRLGMSDSHKANSDAAKVGRKHTREFKDKIIASNKRRIVSQETKDKIALSQKGRVYKPLSLETRAKMRDAALGRSTSQETKDKISAANKATNIRKLLIAPEQSITSFIFALMS